MNTNKYSRIIFCLMICASLAYAGQSSMPNDQQKPTKWQQFKTTVADKWKKVKESAKKTGAAVKQKVQTVFRKKPLVETPEKIILPSTERERERLRIEKEKEQEKATVYRMQAEQKQADEEGQRQKGTRARMEELSREHGELEDIDLD